MLLTSLKSSFGALLVLCFVVTGLLGLVLSREGLLGDQPSAKAASKEQSVGHAEAGEVARGEAENGLEEDLEQGVEPPAASLNARADRKRADEAEQLASFESKVKPTCERIGSKLGSVSVEDCLARQLTASSGRSLQGTPILVKEYLPLDERKPLGKVLLVGGIHGDEYSSVSLVFRWLEMLDQYHSGLFHWRVVPLLNPDGLLRAKSQRMNDRGVDLNRNFPTPNWQEDATDYWVRRTSSNPRRYPGPEPLSEPESRWLHDEILRFRPMTIVTVHAPLEVVDYDGPPNPPTKLGPLFLHQMGTYPGSLGRFGGEYKGLPVVTIELPSAGIMPTDEKLRTIWRDLVSYLGKNIPLQNGIRPNAVATGASG